MGQTFPHSQATMETCIARAHRQLAIARDAASTLADLGWHDDLQMVLIELERMQQDLLRLGPRSRIRRARSYVSQTQERR